MEELIQQKEIDLPNCVEVEKALAMVKNGKDAGKSGILPEMLKAGSKNRDFVDILTDLVSEVWKERQVPQEWVNAILVPIPKKANLHSCDNWRGIA